MVTASNGPLCSKSPDAPPSTLAGDALAQLETQAKKGVSHGKSTFARASSCTLIHSSSTRSSSQPGLQRNQVHPSRRLYESLTGIQNGDTFVEVARDSTPALASPAAQLRLSIDDLQSRDPLAEARRRKTARRSRAAHSPPQELRGEKGGAYLGRQLRRACRRHDRLLHAALDPLSEPPDLSTHHSKSGRSPGAARIFRSADVKKGA